MRPLLICLFVPLLLLCGCKRDIQNEAAVRQGVLNYLSKRSDLSAMDVTVTKIAFRQNEADASVHFQAKNSTAPGTGLDMNYVLERKGNEWIVKGKGAGSGHGGGMGMGTNPDNPHGTAAPGIPPGMALPPGHPSTSTPPAAPGGHPTTPPPPGSRP